MRRGRPRGAGRTLFSLAALAGALLASAGARAQTTPETSPIALEWTAPAECPDRDTIVAAVRTTIGERRETRRTLRARGVVSSSATSPRYHVKLVVTNEAGAERPRTIDDDDCARLGEATALVLALDIDPDALTRDPTEPSPSDGKEPADAPPRRPVSRPTPPLARPAPAAPTEPRSPRRIDVSAGARAVLDSGSLPRPTLGLGAAAAVGTGPFALELQITTYQTKFTQRGPQGGIGGAYVGLFDLSAHACGGGLRIGLDLRACLGGAVGRRTTVGVAIASPESSAGLWSALSALVRARLWPDRVIGPTVGLALVHPLGSSDVTIQGFGPVFTRKDVVFRGFLGLETKW